MGIPNNYLIAPAVLYLNPGITREEFVELLDKTHSSRYAEYINNEPLDHYRLEDERYHDGLEGLCFILGLEDKKDFLKTTEGKIDSNKLFIEPLRLIEWKSKDAEHKYVVINHKKNELLPETTREDNAWEKLNVGDIWEESQCGLETGIITEILGEIVPEDELTNSCDYRYKLKIHPIKKHIDYDEFNTKEEVYAKWPIFHPNNQFNWEQKEGNFSMSSQTRHFFWKQKEGKYYLDEKTFNTLPATSTFGGILGYTDLILTAEAIKHGAWKVLSYLGMNHTNEFLNKIPKAKKAYDKAVIDSHTSLYAKQNKWTLFDLIRYRCKNF